MNTRVIIAFISCLVFPLALLAQKKDSRDYSKMKREINEKIFDTPDPFFKDNTVPEKYKNESAVVLAQKHSIESDSKRRFGILSGAQYGH